MKKGDIAKKGMIFLFIMMFLLATLGALSIYAVHRLQGNARVVNYVAMVRGGSQKLVKSELMGYPDDATLARLEAIIGELVTGEGTVGLVLLPDAQYQANMRLVQAGWEELKAGISSVRAGESGEMLFAFSEDFFTLADRTVLSAQAYSERRLAVALWLTAGMMAVMVLCLCLFTVGIFRTRALRRRAATLDATAFTDSLTQLPNKAGCERELQRLEAAGPGREVGAVLFDMDNINRVNSRYGRAEGDRLIAEFARILTEEAKGQAFVGRAGGDEFIALFEDGSAAQVRQYLTRVNARVVAGNLLLVEALEKISFAAGYAVERLGPATAEEIVAAAERNMRANGIKRG